MTRTARTTWIVIGLTSRYSRLTHWGADVLRPDTHSSIPFHQLHPPVKLSDRWANNFTNLSAHWRSCRPRADANRRHCYHILLLILLYNVRPMCHKSYQYKCFTYQCNIVIYNEHTSVKFIFNHFSTTGLLRCDH